MRFSLLSLLILVATQMQATTNVPCSPPLPRDFVGGARLLAIATPTSPKAWHIDQVLLGDVPASGELQYDIDHVRACALPVVGKSYLIGERCPENDGPCEIATRSIEEAADYLAFLHARHAEEWTTIIEAAKRWSDGRISNVQFNSWIRTADTDEPYRYSSTLLLVRYLEGMSNDLEEVARLAPKVADRMMAVIVKRGLCEIDGRWSTPPDYKELDLALTAIMSGPEWRGLLEEAYRNGS
jgi:hypothetical protein